MPITTGSKVTLEFTLNVDGQTVSQTGDEEPFEYVHGENEILPGLEAQLEGLSEGESKAVVLPPYEGYGAVDETLFKKVDIDMIPEEYRQEGMFLQQEKDGETLQFRIKEVASDHILLDLNHPFAGKILEFDVTIVTVD